jgi:RNA polymerase sigma-70 factor (ECF subfamily)
MDSKASRSKPRINIDATSSSVLEPCRSLSEEQLTLLPDTELLDCIKSGHNANAAADVLFTRYRRLVLSICFKILRDPVEAEDVTQDILIEVWRKARLFDATRGTAKMWILQYAYSRSLNRRKYLSLHQSNGHNGNGNGHSKAAELEPAITPDPSSALTLEERQTKIINSLGDLPAKHRRAIELIYFESLSLREVSEKMGESIGNVRHFYYRGIQKLRLAFTELAAKNGK